MRFIKNGRAYDTKTADEIYEISGGGEFPSDVCYWQTRLCRKKTGEFFLAFWPSIRSGDNNYVRPVSEKEAKCWLENNAPGNVYEEIFGVCPE